MRWRFARPANVMAIVTPVKWTLVAGVDINKGRDRLNYERSGRKWGNLVFTHFNEHSFSARVFILSCQDSYDFDIVAWHTYIWHHCYCYLSHYLCVTMLVSLFHYTFTSIRRRDKTGRSYYCQYTAIFVFSSEKNVAVYINRI